METGSLGVSSPYHPRLIGKRAVVTGAASGIGRAIALRFAAEGARVAVWDIDQGKADAVALEILAAGGDAIACAVDVARSDAIQSATTETVANFGSVDILVNNAGIHDDYVGILEADEQLWDRIVGANLKGMWLVSRALLPLMLAGQQGAIINIASISSFTANGGGTIYTAAKHGVVGFTRRMAYELASRGVRVNAIAPGALETGITAGLEADPDSEVMQRIRQAPAGRMAKASEIANVALFLAGDEASFVHGAVYTVDGGWLIR
jgi:3-oxoacyl-[acyl-carrier protein] reductase